MAFIAGEEEEEAWDEEESVVEVVALAVSGETPAAASLFLKSASQRDSGGLKKKKNHALSFWFQMYELQDVSYCRYVCLIPQVLALSPISRSIMKKCTFFGSSLSVSCFWQRQYHST